jgi:sugar-specific transcriptional regulator TrmB
MIESILRGIGLTNYETKVYLALLDLGESTSGKILAKAGMHSGKIYEILDSLKSKGLVSEITKSGVKHFSPAEPTRVRDYLADKKREIEEQEKDFDGIMPLLMKKIGQVKGKTTIEIFTGYKGLKTAYGKEIQRYKKNSVVRVLGITPREKQVVNKKYYDYFPYYVRPLRDKNNIRMRKILSEDARKDLKYQEKGAELRFLPYDSMAGFNISEDLVIIGIFTDEPIFISIESREVAKSFIDSFEAMWKVAKK